MRVYVPGIERAASLNTMSVLDSIVKSNDAWRFLSGEQGTELFSPFAAGLSHEPVSFANGVSITPAVVAGETEPPDMVIVPGLDDDILPSLDRNREWVGWVRRWHEQGAIVASSCTGAFVLAEAGILDGKTATTHWVAEPLFRSLYPRARLVIGPVVVDEGNVITSGGATTAFNLIHYLVSRFGSAERARAMTRMMEIDSGRESQLPFAMTGIYRQHNDGLVHQAQSAVQQGKVSPLSVASLAAVVGVSPRTLVRRFQAAIGVSPQSYLEDVRIETAKRLLENTSRQVEDIRQEVGFEDPSAFRRAFKRAVAITPSEYRKRFAARSGRPVAVA